MGFSVSRQRRPLLKATLVKHHHLTSQRSMRLTCKNCRVRIAALVLIGRRTPYSSADVPTSIRNAGKLLDITSGTRFLVLYYLSLAAVSTRSTALSCAELAILGDAGDHELPIQPASTIARDRVEPVGASLLEEGAGRLAEPLEPSKGALAILLYYSPGAHPRSPSVAPTSAASGL